MTRKYKHKTDKRYTSDKPKALPRTFQQGFLASLDKRTDLAKALRSNYNEITDDIGGIGDVSRIKGSLIERYVWLEAVLQTLEHEMALGLVDKATVLSKWIVGVNTLTNLARTLGVEKKATARPWCNVQSASTEDDDTDTDDSAAETTELAEVST
jgi:hypothetical protein